MKDPIKPIKRSSQLTPLSKDHHEGLLFSWKINRGIQKGLDPERIVVYVRWFWKNDLEEHFREEEEILAPFLKESPMVQRMIDEHRQIKGMIDSPALSSNENLSKLATLVHDHIRFEERELFQAAEEQLDPKDLDNIGEQLAAHPRRNLVWEDEFWLGK